MTSSSAGTIPARHAKRLLAGLLGVYALGFGLLQWQYWQLARLDDLRRHAGPSLRIFAVLFAAYFVLAWATVTRLPKLPAHVMRWLLPLLLAAGVVFRLTLAPLTPSLSDDIYRYVWDGRVQLAGINPYQHAPADDALRPLRDGHWLYINHKEIPSIYPPLMQQAYRLGASIAPTLPAQKWLFLACDLALMALLPAVLALWGVSPWFALLYAWHPLVVIEVAGSGHNDALGVLWMVAGLALWRMRRPVVATFAWALCALSKLTTLVMIPWLAVRHRRLLALFVAIIAAAVLPYASMLPRMAGVSHYGQPWEFNSSLYALLNQLVHHPLAARGILVAVLAGLSLWLAMRIDDPLTYLTRMIQALILCTPVLEPWYLLWLIPLLCFRPSWTWLAFSALVMLSYAVLVQYATAGVWRIPEWIRWVEYTPLYAGLLVEGWSMLRRARSDRRRGLGPAASVPACS